MVNAILVKEGLELLGELPFTIRANGAELEAEGCDVRIEDAAQRRRGVALALRIRVILNRVQLTTHSIAHLPPQKGILRKGLVRLSKSLPARLLARLFMTFGTAYHRTLASEHRTHGTHLLVMSILAALTVSHVMRSMGCPRRWWSCMMSCVVRLAATRDFDGVGLSRLLRVATHRRALISNRPSSRRRLLTIGDFPPCRG